MMTGNLQLDLGGFALNSGDFSIPLHGVTVLFGRSGSGKSTLLRALAGLDKRTRGHLTVNGCVWQQNAKALPAQNRDIGFVFQDAALFPHLTVRQNLTYGIQRVPRATAPADFNEIVARIGILDLLDRKVTYLSGGERQRVAIARALLMQPKLLCMDEPLSALDWRAKAELLALIETVIEQYHLPVLYITHAPSEVERLADRVLFMKDGQIERMETLQHALARPDSPLFDEQGAVSVLLGTPREQQGGLQRIVMNQNVALNTEQSLWVSPHLLAQKPQVRVRILARDVSIGLADPQNLSIINHLNVEVTELIAQGDYRMLVRLRLADGQFLFAEITQASAKRLQLQPGLLVFALIKTVAMTE